MAESASIKENGRVQISPGAIQVGLNNPYASLEVLADAGTYTRKDTVLNIANRTDAYAAINGDFKNTVIAHPERNAAQRRIVNGIGVTNKLKKAWDSNLPSCSAPSCQES